MKLIEILTNDSFIVEYNPDTKQYRVSYFGEDNHWQDECWFDAYEKATIEALQEKIDDLQIDMEYYMEVQS